MHHHCHQWPCPTFLLPPSRCSELVSSSIARVLRWNQQAQVTGGGMGYTIRDVHGYTFERELGFTRQKLWFMKHLCILQLVYPTAGIYRPNSEYHPDLELFSYSRHWPLTSVKMGCNRKHSQRNGALLKLKAVRSNIQEIHITHWVTKQGEKNLLFRLFKNIFSAVCPSIYLCVFPD